MRHDSVSLPLLQQLEPLLQTARFGRQVRGYTSTDSTNTQAAAWARDGAPEGSLVIAEEQTAGRGRHGRQWEAAAEQNLTFSLVLRPALTPERLGLIILAAGVAVAEAIEAFTAPLRPSIKWPNDVLLEGRKCCGMLLETTHDGRPQETGPVILGIGLNVNQDAFPSTFTMPATSLLLATGRHVPRAPLLARLLQTLETQYNTLFEDEGTAVRAAYEDRLMGRGEPIALHVLGTDTPVEGRLQGITETGALCLSTPTGTAVYHAGEVTTQRITS